MSFSDFDYHVTVKTGDDPLAGTDSNVFLQMFGEEGQSKKFLLRDEGDENKFGRGKTDKFVIRTKDVGKVRLFSLPTSNLDMGKAMRGKELLLTCC